MCGNSSFFLPLKHGTLDRVGSEWKTPANSSCLHHLLHPRVQDTRRVQHRRRGKIWTWVDPVASEAEKSSGTAPERSSNASSARLCFEWFVGALWKPGSCLGSGTKCVSCYTDCPAKAETLMLLLACLRIFIVLLIFLLLFQKPCQPVIIWFGRHYFGHPQNSISPKARQAIAETKAR